MSMRHALLGFLNRKPMTGYELKQVFDSTVHFFWNAELSQIYPALKSMQREGLLSMHIEHQEDRPNRKVYEITEQGREEFEGWMRQPTELPSLKDAFLIKLFFGGATDRATIRRQLEHQLEAHRARLRFYETSQWDPRDGDGASSAEREYSALTLEWALRYERTCIEWCDWALEQLSPPRGERRAIAAARA